MKKVLKILSPGVVRENGFSRRAHFVGGSLCGWFSSAGGLARFANFGEVIK